MILKIPWVLYCMQFKLFLYPVLINYLIFSFSKKMLYRNYTRTMATSAELWVLWFTSWFGSSSFLVLVCSHLRGWFPPSITHVGSLFWFGLDLISCFLPAWFAISLCSPCGVPVMDCLWSSCVVFSLCSPRRISVLDWSWFLLLVVSRQLLFKTF